MVHTKDARKHVTCRSGDRRWPAWLLAGFVGILGLAFTGGGLQLALLGGSPYYILAGIALLLTAVLVARQDHRAARLYALVLVASLGWAIWEVGFDGWGLVPRLVAPLVLGLLFVPAVLRRRRIGPGPFPWNGAGLMAGAVAAVALGGIVHAFGPARPVDPLEQIGRTALPAVQATAVAAATLPTDGDWKSYGNDGGGTRFSPLAQITAANVAKLGLAWVYHTGFAPSGARSGLEVTPLKIGDRLYICTGYSDVISLDAETGRQIWRHHARSSTEGVQIGACRGVAYYQVPGASGVCAARIISATVDARLIALDAATGRPCEDFGVHGETSLLTGMGKVIKGYYYVTSAPTVIRGKVVLGGWVTDGQFWGEPSGVIRAFDAVTGRFAWAFDMGRPDDHGEPAPGKSYTPATPNSWAPMSADESLGLVYVPTGNATPDYYGAQRRPFDDKYSSSVIALDGETGAVRWSFQTTHHDLWDYDVPAQPTLVDIPHAGGIERALIQPTKRGEIFLLDRVTGKPLAEVAERPVPTRGAAPGERVSPTQPFSIGMPSFRGADLRERDMWGVTPLDQLWCRIKFKQARYDGTLTPPGLTPSINFPGYLGGITWGGVSIDRDRNLMIVNSNRVPVYARLVTREDANRQGIRVRREGLGSDAPGGQAQARTPFAAIVLPFLSPSLSPCNAPPYGLITAVDLTSRKVLWSRPLGTTRDSGPFGIPLKLPLPMGLPNSGGSIVTRGGLIFIAATQERTLRALDVRTGQELWSARLPAGGQATPATYWSDRSKRQFVVTAAGGNIALMAAPGDAIVAYALPRK